MHIRLSCIGLNRERHNNLVCALKREIEKLLLEDASTAHMVSIAWCFETERENIFSPSPCFDPELRMPS